MSALALAVIAPSLDDLAATVRREDQLAAQAGAAMVCHAINAGKALVDAKHLVPPGEWERWLGREFPDRHLKTLRLYMRLARHEDVLLERNPATITAANRMIAGETLRPSSHELRGEAKKLSKDGLTQRQIASRLGVSQPTVGEWLNPAIKERRRQRMRRESRAARRALHRQERDHAARKVGGATAEAYALVRRAAQALERAQGRRRAAKPRSISRSRSGASTPARTRS